MIQRLYYFDSTLDFEEVDVRKILRPMSHSKYIKDPDYDYMLFINRKEGLVPLSSLAKEDSKTVLSSNVRLLKGRNVRLGKPKTFVRDKGRMVAVGGSRSPSGDQIKIIRAPKLVKILPMEKQLPFRMDSEYANFAASAIPDMKKISKKVDIRVLKKMKRLQDLENRPLQEKLSDGNQSIVNHLYDKLNPSTATEKNIEMPKKKPEINTGESNSEEKENIEEEDSDQDEVGFGTADKAPIHNEWANNRTKGQMPIGKFNQMILSPLGQKIRIFGLDSLRTFIQTLNLSSNSSILRLLSLSRSRV